MSSVGTKNQHCLVSQDANMLAISVVGTIDENFEFPRFDKVPALVRIDLAKTTGINSRGIRDWIEWISRFINTRIELHNCPKLIIDQVNMVQDFVPKNAHIISFFVPYYSEDTEEEKQVLFLRGQHFDQGRVDAPTDIVDSAGNAMEIDVIESKFFHFLLK